MMPSLDGKVENENGNSESCKAKSGKSNAQKSTPIPPEEVFINIMKKDFGTNSKKIKQEKNKKSSVPYWKLYRYADKWDYMNIIIGTIAGIIHGVGLPIMFVFFGDLTTQFTQYGRYEQCRFLYNACHSMNLTTINQSEWDRTVQVQLDSFKQTNIEFVLYFIYIACGVFVFGSVQVTTWSIQATRQAKRLRAAYFNAILRQDIGFHDVTPSGELHTMLLSDIKRVKDGIGEKISMVIQYVSMTLAGLVISLLYAWKLALVTLAVAPLLVLSGALLFILSDVYTRKELESYAKAGAVAKEAISSIRTVTAFGGQSNDVERYAAAMKGARVVGVKRGFISGFSIGLLYISMFGMYGLSFWYGSMLVIAEEITAGELTTSFFAILIASFALGTAGAYVGTFSEATAAATKLFQVIDRVPDIDVFSDDGKDPDPDDYELSFHDVSFSYPSRPEIEVLKGISLKVGNGEMVALVGHSGSGKSTIVQLIQRFYDPISGKVSIGGRNIRTLSVRKLRDMIGVVSQEPVLFEASIAENIRWGCEGVTDEEVEKAARSANAYSFIKKLPKGFDTLVGESGGQLSGGQKQRIAIARAIVRDPKILLLDEATSALDAANESAVQIALQNASTNRITVVIAHRLSTIRSAHKIIVLQNGRIVEKGSHDQLVKITNGVYKNLTLTQVGVDHNLEKQPKEHIIDPSRFLRESATSQTGSQRRSNRWNRTWSSRILKKENSFSLIPSNFAKEIILKDPTSPYASLRRKLDGGSVSSYHSVFSLSEPDEEIPEDDKDLKEVSFRKLLMMNKPEWSYMAGGSIFAIIAGAVDPINSIVFANVLTIFIMDNPLAQIERAKLYGLLFLALGFISFIAFTAEATLFAKSGIELTLRLRKKTLWSILRQNIAFFDDHANSTGTLCNRLSSDAARVQGSTGGRVGIIVKNLSSLGVALGIGFWFSWKLTLVTLAFVPFIVIGGIIEMHLIIGEEGSSQGNAEAGQLASQVIENIRTVASLRSEHIVYQCFLSKLHESLRKVSRKALLIGVGYGYSQCVIFLVFAATFRLGIELVESGEVKFASVFKVLSAVFFGAMAIGQNTSFAPDYAEAKLSASRLFALFDRQPIIDAHSRKGHSPAQCRGAVALKSVYFHYPARPDVSVLHGCDLTIEAGKTLALVGQSGCGKSTVIQLLERFYDPKVGQVFIDDYNVKKLNVSWLRNRVGLVSQEPVLFDRTIKENIRYGDNTRVADDEEVMEAARKANADQFVKEFSKGYDTRVGEQGSQLSGGQKQRIAIARALLRNPKILLLDEATSALDAESEKIVQEALDKARSGRTTIVVAHRLSTVKNADKIAVIDRGRIVEVGTHNELLAKRRTYYNLVNAQLSPSEKEKLAIENANSDP